MNQALLERSRPYWRLCEVWLEEIEVEFMTNVELFTHCL